MVTTVTMPAVDCELGAQLLNAHRVLKAMQTAGCTSMQIVGITGSNMRFGDLLLTGAQYTSACASIQDIVATKLRALGIALPT